MRAGENIRHCAARRRRAKAVAASLLGLALTGSILTYPTQTNARACRDPAHQRVSEAETSIEVRKLMTHLMVAALRCDARSDYNGFVVNYQSTIKKYGRVIRGEFKRRYGSSGRRQLNEYVTKLANEASARSNAGREAFCAAADDMFRKAEDEQVPLARLVLTYTGASSPSGHNRTAGAACPPERKTALKPVDDPNRAER